jgi:hypothetical protein
MAQSLQVFPADVLDSFLFAAEHDVYVILEGQVYEAKAESAKNSANKNAKIRRKYGLFFKYYSLSDCILEKNAPAAQAKNVLMISVRCLTLYGCGTVQVPLHGDIV